MRRKRNRENGNGEHPPPSAEALFDFWNGLNAAMGYMEPAQRKVVNQARQAAAKHGLTFTDALSSYLTTPTALPMEVLYRFRRADEIL